MLLGLNSRERDFYAIAVGFILKQILFTLFFFFSLDNFDLQTTPQLRQERIYRIILSYLKPSRKKIYILIELTHFFENKNKYTNWVWSSPLDIYAEINPTAKAIPTPKYIAKSC